jgi:hypothetical protein
MAKQGELVVIQPGFDYSLIKEGVVEQVRSAAERIRQKVKKTLEDVIEIGNDLLAVKEALPHGQFLPWLKAEFGWRERMAQNFMSVAERFGPKPAMIADLAIQPTAAYLLAAPSAPDEARQKAVEMAEAGEQITPKVAKKILARAKKKKGRRKFKALATETLGQRLANVLERYKVRWKPDDLEALVKQLREFADALEEGQRDGRKKAKG